MALAPQTVKHDYIKKTGEEEDEEEETTEKRSLEEQERQGEETETGGTPKRYVPLCEKVKARKMTTTLKTAATTPLLDQTLTQPHHHLNNEEEDHRHMSSDIKPPPTRPPLIKLYTRRRRPKGPRLSPDSLAGVKEEQEEEVDRSVQQQQKKQKNNSDKKNKGKGRVIGVNTMGLGADLSAQLQVSPSTSHGVKLKSNCISSSRRRKTGGFSGSSQNLDCSQMVNSAAKRWVRLSFDGADRKNFIGLQCKVYWPLDDDWYTGRVVGYNAETGRYHVSYEDGDEEDIIISNERVKFYISRDEMLRLNLSYKIGTSDLDGLEFSEMVVKLKNNCISSSRRRKTGCFLGSSQNLDCSQMVNSTAKRWVWLSFDVADCKNFIGLQCKVYWPLDDDWYTGRVVGYNAETGRYHVSYEDGDEEDIIISNESVKFYISRDEMLRLNLSYKIGTSDLDGLEFS